MSRKSVGFVGSSDPFVSVDSLFVESFPVLVVNGRFRTTSSTKFVMNSLGTVGMSSGYRMRFFKWGVGRSFIVPGAIVSVVDIVGLIVRSFVWKSGIVTGLVAYELPVVPRSRAKSEHKVCGWPTCLENGRDPRRSPSSEYVGLVYDIPRCHVE